MNSYSPGQLLCNIIARRLQEVHDTLHSPSITRLILMQSKKVFSITNEGWGNYLAERKLTLIQFIKTGN